MKIYKSSSGPFTEKPFYKPAEVEQICDEELRSVNLLPSEPSAIRVERFIEKRFKISPSYEEIPEGILGFITFGKDGVKSIVISSTLAESNSKVDERRINTTLAHEAGHGLLHAHLFALGEVSSDLFNNEFDPNKPKILCRNNAIQGIPGYNKKGYDGCWWEYQANLAIGPLLLPQNLVMLQLKPYLINRGSLALPSLDPQHQQKAINDLAETFEVNPIVAKIRLEFLFPGSNGQQLTL
jgi:hypothetical protein